MTEPYGYYMKGYRCIFGEGKFELSSARGVLTEIHLAPTHKGQEPFACINPSAGLYLFYPESMKEHHFLAPVYVGKEKA